MAETCGVQLDIDDCGGFVVASCLLPDGHPPDYHRGLTHDDRVPRIVSWSTLEYLGEDRLAVNTDFTTVLPADNRLPALLQAARAEREAAEALETCPCLVNDKKPDTCEHGFAYDAALNALVAVSPWASEGVLHADPSAIADIVLWLAGEEVADL